MKYICVYCHTPAYERNWPALSLTNPTQVLGTCLKMHLQQGTTLPSTREDEKREFFSQYSLRDFTAVTSGAEILQHHYPWH